MRGVDDAVVAACRVFVDTRDGAPAEAYDLAELCCGAVAGRACEAERTLFKSVGNALEALAPAELVWERAAK